MRTGGLSFVRADASWSSIEPAAPVAGVHTYVWSVYDRFVADLARSGLRWYPMLGYATSWATSRAGDLLAPPARDADFATFVAAVARRYGSGGSFWSSHPELPRLPTTVYEIWNEPSNHTFWGGTGATPTRYMALYVAARAAIDAVDPRARVVTAGILDSGFVDGRAYLRAMLAGAPGARNQIDAVGWHPYVGDIAQIASSIWRARVTLDEYGLNDVPLEISEVGWHSGVPQPLRVATIRRLATILPYANLNVSRLLPYVWSGDPAWQIANPDGSPGPLATAYFAGIGGAHSPEPLALSPITTAQPTTGSKTCVVSRRRSSRNGRRRLTRTCDTGVRLQARTVGSARAN